MYQKHYIFYAGFMTTLLSVKGFFNILHTLKPFHQYHCFGLMLLLLVCTRHIVFLEQFCGSVSHNSVCH